MTGSRFSDEAVSPVVGVMLMLVVTLIIAAVISGFAGSMVDSVASAPQVTLEGTYSQDSGMTIRHAGGDVIPLSGVAFATMPSEVMGTEYEAFYYDINPVVMKYTNTSNLVSPIMDNSSGFYYKTSFAPGDIITIDAADCDDYADDGQLAGHSKTDKYYTGGTVNANAQVNWPSTDGTKELYFRSYEFDNPDNVGKYFYLYLIDSAQSVIAKAKVRITA